MKKVIVFDFDGTLVDSKKLYIDTIYSSFKKHSFIHPKKVIEAALGPKLEMTLERIQKFLPKTVASIKENVNNDISKRHLSLKLCSSVKETLKRLKKEGCILILLTNSTGRFVKLILKKNKILQYFDRLFYAENFSDKEDALEGIAKKYKTEIKNIIYVADKISDVNIAKRVNCQIVIVLACSWDKRYFIKNRKDYVIKSLKELNPEQF